MAKINNTEQDNYNNERIIDIMAVIGYMKDYDVYNNFFTDTGDGFLQGVVGVNNNVKFVSENKYLKLKDKFEVLEELNSDTDKIMLTNNRLEERNKELKELLNKKLGIINNYMHNYRKKFF